MPNMRANTILPVRTYAQFCQWRAEVAGEHTEAEDAGYRARVLDDKAGLPMPVGEVDEKRDR